MAGKTDLWSNSILGLLTDDATPVALATSYVGLFTVAPSDAYTGGAPDGTEVPTTGNYVRKPITAANWSALTAGSPGREISNDLALTWAAWDTGSQTLSHFGVFDAVGAGGNLLYWAALTTQRTIEDGETATFDPNVLVVNED